LEENTLDREWQQMKIFMELDESKTKEKTMMYSTTLPKGLKGQLHEATKALHRKKADWIRTALSLFLELNEKEQAIQIIKSYQDMDLSQLRPFTTTLFEGQLKVVDLLSKALKRSKAEIIRTSIFVFLSKSVAIQETEIKKYLSR
jgi:predicted transcriptional regulator